jgi:alkyl hydroperoxide reductase subunit AhpC
MIDIPLLSDSTHRLSRDYGVLVEEEDVSLRGMFIIDGQGIVQQVSLNSTILLPIKVLKVLRSLTISR